MRVVCLVLAILAIAPHAAACVCAGLPFFDESVLQSSRYHAVFEGVVTDKRIVIEDYYGLWVPMIHSEVTVERVWKGNRVRTILVREGFDSCAGHYAAGMRYVFVADGYDPVTNTFSASGCSPSRRIASPARSQEVTGILGAPAATFAEVRELPGRGAEFRYRLRLYLASGVAAAHNVSKHPRDEIARSQWVTWTVIGIFLGGIIGVAGLLVATVGSRQTLSGWLLFIAGTLAATPVVLAAAGYVYIENSYLRQSLLWSWT